MLQHASQEASCSAKSHAEQMANGMMLFANGKALKLQGYTDLELSQEEADEDFAKFFTKAWDD